MLNTDCSVSNLAAKASGRDSNAPDNLLRIVKYFIIFEFMCGITSEPDYLEKLPLLSIIKSWNYVQGYLQCTKRGHHTECQHRDGRDYLARNRKAIINVFP